MSPASGDVGPRPERGVALLIVLVVLFIVAVLMIDITLTATTARSSAINASSDFLMDAAIEARYQVALAQLRYDWASDQGKLDSTDDRWAREEYTRFENATTDEEREEKAAQEEDTGQRVIGNSEEVSVTATIQDEERKFNLNLLMHPDAKKREVSRRRFVVLLDRYREDTPLDLSAARAQDLCDKVVEYLERAKPGEGERGRVPVPKAGTWRLLTPDELRLVTGFEDSTHGFGAEGLLYEARDPEEVRIYMQDPEGVEAPKSHPGLLRFVTLWSGTAWTGEAPAPDTWIKLNLNTAEKPVLETLFLDHPSDFLFAERIIEYREAQKEGSSGPDEGESAAVDEPLSVHQTFENIEDLKKVDGLEQAVLDRNPLIAEVADFKSGTFSIDILAEHEDATKQVRFVVRRHSEGFQTLLREERQDPRFEEEKPEDEQSEPVPK